MTGGQRHTEGWDTLPWKHFERNIFRLQKRIYKASLRGDFKQVRNLQRLLLRSYSARCLAVRRVTQDNRGKRTAGVDGIAKVPPHLRMEMVEMLCNLRQPASPIRRVYIPKHNSPEMRPLGIPVMLDRALQALVKLALEPEWEAKFEPNSYGFRPGRCCHDALEAIYNYIRLKPKFVLDADIEKCFDRINHEALLVKLATIPVITDLIRGWLKAGIFEKGIIAPSEAGTPQGGVVSPLLANIALHGMETALVESLPKSRKPAVIRYADDFVILHEDLATLLQLKEQAEKWLATIGLNLKAAKTRITHTLHKHDGKVGFDFLGFTVRQFPMSKRHARLGFKTFIKPSKASQQRHLAEMADVIHKHRGSNQTALLTELNPKVRGWTNYYRVCTAKKVFDRMDNQIHWKLLRWAKRRHSHKHYGWCRDRYWQRKRERLDFCDGNATLIKYADAKIRRHVKVQATKSPFDGDGAYWLPRLHKDSSLSERVVLLLNRQKCRCGKCGLRLRSDDLLEVHHKDRNRQNNQLNNLELLHGHCHDEVHRELCS
ncbi:MAG: group II intron reverse transcriptase/maturase [Leptolyngbyaceae cyanobacterium CSU_1_3]|nr:group II intron reverse transcriptase/maturase [Leptolyngbyaceae cyanobacterium CSU_1_3]